MDGDMGKAREIESPTDALRALVRLIEEFVDGAVLREPSARHPAARRWQLLQEVLRNSGNINIEANKSRLPLLVSAMLDAVAIAKISSGSTLSFGSLDAFGDAGVQRKIRTRLRDHKQYDSM